MYIHTHTHTHRTNEDDFTPVDLAVMLNHTTIAKMLLAKGAKDSTKCMYTQLPFHIPPQPMM